MKSDMRDMKDSGVEWLGEIPAHWEVKRLKHVSSVRTSNVDKKSKDNEASVDLVNYTDVYYNERITSAIEFMTATANAKQIELFQLQEGDVIVTKDSETWDDIAVPAYVGEAFVGVLCGYHLALIRPNGNLSDGEYIARQFASSPGAYQFKVGANGVTRFGLPQRVLRDALFLIPPLHEQRAIASYLDHETAKLDALIAKSQRLIDLLREKRTALISAAVTRGLDANVEMRESGVEWLGEIPGHWDSIPTHTVTLLSGTHDPRQEPGVDFRYIDVSSVCGETNCITEHEQLAGHDAPTRARNVVFEGDTIFATVRPYLRNIAQIPCELHDSICSTGFCVLRPNRETLQSRYLFFLCISAEFVSSIVAHQQGVSYPAVSDRVVRRQVIPLPPLHEQRAIASYLDHETAKLDALIAKSQRLIDLLREKRTALISAAVTGKISVDPSPPPAPPQSIGEGSLQSSKCL